jgi:hypothetical protein
MIIRKKILFSLFVLLSLVIIVEGVMFVVSQMINIKYYFDTSLPCNNSEHIIPICTRKFVSELILYAEIIVGYAICALILVISYIRKELNTHDR